MLLFVINKQLLDFFGIKLFQENSFNKRWVAVLQEITLFAINKQIFDCFRNKVISREQSTRARVAVFQAITLHVTVLKIDIIR